MSEWKDIETVPEEGLVDLWWDNGPGEQFRVSDCEYRDEFSFIDDGGTIIPRDYVTHWMPIPFGPKQKAPTQTTGK